VTNSYRVAVHEAGHCAACVVFGIPIISVSISGDPHMRRARWRAPTGSIGIEAMAVLCLAGGEAENLLCGELADGGDDIDLEMARGYLAQRFGPLRIGAFSNSPIIF
jgi:hypothetical protein